jgi:hypothetical protein
MSNATETAARNYVALWAEPDPAARARILEACFAADARLVTPGTRIIGRAALADAVDRFLADPRGLVARLTSAIDLQGPLFRFHSVVEDRDGNVIAKGFDAGEVGADGRIAVLFAFSGPF